MPVSRNMLSIVTGAAFMCPAFLVGQVAAAPVPRSSPVSIIVSGHTEPVPVVQVNGHTYVDLNALARVTDSTLAYRASQITLTLAPAPSPAPANAAVVPKPTRSFSQAFLTAGIEEMTVVREWRIALVNAVQNNYPINEDWVSQYRRNADSKLALASAAAGTDADRQTYPLLANEFNNMQKQSDRFLAMRKNLQFISTYSLDQDALDQQILACSRGLAALASGGQFEDVPSCH